ncbi:MAG: hypothetical protein M1838_004153, partial [Thelocarpon superellum]
MSLAWERSLEHELRRESQYIRNILAPVVCQYGGKAFSGDTLILLMTFLERLEQTTVSLDVIRRSRIEKALFEITDEGSGWPVSLMELAARILKTWNIRMGDLRDLRAPLWDKDMRMARCRKEWTLARVQTMQYGHDSRVEVVKQSEWVVEHPAAPAMQCHGHRGFEVGDWWIEPACAYRDGMLDEANSHVAVGIYGAYAIVMAKGEETETDNDTVKWKCTGKCIKPSSTGAGVLSLMSNMRNHTHVRLLRSWKLKSRWAPRGGVRYDGLYSVIGIGVKKTDGITHFTFELTRAGDQPGMARAQLHPNADEYDDWTDYVKYKAESKEANALALLNQTDGEMDADGGENEDESESENEAEGDGD